MDSIDEAKEKEAAYDAWARVSYEEAPDPIDAFVDGWLACACAQHGQAVAEIPSTLEEVAELVRVAAKPWLISIGERQGIAHGAWNAIAAAVMDRYRIAPTPPPSPQGRGEPTAKACPRGDGKE